MTDRLPAFTPFVEPAPLRSALLLTGFVLVGMTVGALLATVVVWAGSLAVGNPDGNVTLLLQQPESTPGGWWLLMGVQAVSHLATYLIPALLYWQLIERQPLSHLGYRPVAAVVGWGLVVMLTIAFMPVNGLVIEWNQSLTLPDTLAPLERWMRAKEDDLGKLTRFMTAFSSVPQLVAALLIIGLVASLGEEVLFRGVLQRKFITWTGNLHVGIWLAAALFSAIHFQFYGFVPRMLLGALFGYLFVWSGNLWVPVLAHFVNNGFTVLLLFLYQRKLTTLNVEGTESVSPTAALLGTLLSVGLLVMFKRLNERKIR